MKSPQTAADKIMEICSKTIPSIMDKEYVSFLRKSMSNFSSAKEKKEEIPSLNLALTCLMQCLFFNADQQPKELGRAPYGAELILPIIKTLLSAKIDPNLSIVTSARLPPTSCTLLALEIGRSDIVKIFIEAGASPGAPIEDIFFSISFSWRISSVHEHALSTWYLIHATTGAPEFNPHAWIDDICAQPSFYSSDINTGDQWEYNKSKSHSLITKFILLKALSAFSISQHKRLMLSTILEIPFPSTIISIIVGYSGLSQEQILKEGEEIIRSTKISLIENGEDSKISAHGSEAFLWALHKRDAKTAHRQLMDPLNPNYQPKPKSESHSSCCVM